MQADKRKNNLMAELTNEFGPLLLAAPKKDGRHRQNKILKTPQQQNTSTAQLYKALIKCPNPKKLCTPTVEHSNRTAWSWSHIAQLVAQRYWLRKYCSNFWKLQKLYFLIKVMSTPFVMKESLYFTNYKLSYESHFSCVLNGFPIFHINNRRKSK